MEQDSVSEDLQDVQEINYFADYLRFVDSVPQFRAIKEHSFEALALNEGSVVLDAGCGIGLDTCRIGARAGKSGKVIGLDSNPSMVSFAEKNRPPDLQNVSFVHGDLLNLDFPDNFFNAIHIERTIEHLQDPKPALKNLCRVLKQGGTLVIVEPDFETATPDPGDRDATRSLVSFCADNIGDGWIGRKLHRIMRETGFEVRIETEPVILYDYPTFSRITLLEKFVPGAVTAGVITREEADRLMEGWKQAGDAGNFFWSMVMFRAIGKKL
jgi:ubiquinone/menaquinone biosynthesis C-methylase UbiE